MWTREKPRTGREGKRWLFAYWHEGPRDQRQIYPQQLFFWDEERSECGVVLFTRDKAKRYAQIRGLMEKLAADPMLRKEHSKQLRFPVQRYYRKNGFVAY